jgi:hypothetical protein
LCSSKEWTNLYYILLRVQTFLCPYLVPEQVALYTHSSTDFLDEIVFLNTGQLHLTTYMTYSQYHVFQIPIFYVFHLRLYLTLQTIKSTFGPLCSCTDRLFYFTVELKVHRKDPLMEVLLMSDLLARGFDGLIVRLSAIYTILGIQTHFRKWRSVNTCAAIAEWHHYQQRQRGQSFEASVTLPYERRAHVIWKGPGVRKKTNSQGLCCSFILSFCL